MKTLTLEIPLPPTGCSPNRAGSHWAPRSRARKLYRNEAWAAAKEQGKGWRADRVTISATFFCGRQMAQDGRYRPDDEDNARAALKGALDGLVLAKVIPNDTADHVTWGSVTLARTKTQHGGRMGVVLVIESLDGEGEDIEYGSHSHA